MTRVLGAVLPAIYLTAAIGLALWAAINRKKQP